jgi:Protein of unknown function (DUF2637)
MTDRARLFRRLTWWLVAAIAALAFARSFEAIAAYAGSQGWGEWMKFTAPLLVDTFTLAAMLVILVRAIDGVRAVYAWCLLAAASAASVALNVAHAPDRLPAQVLAALPPAALLAAVELGMSEARRSRKTPAAEATREGSRSAGAQAPGGRAVLPPASGAPAATPKAAAPLPGADPAPSPATPGSDPATVRALAVREHLREHPGATHRDLGAMLRERGIGVGNRTRFGELVAGIKAEGNGSDPLAGPWVNGIHPGEQVGS